MLVQVPLSVVFVAVFDWGPMGVLLANLMTAAGMQLLLLPTYIRKIDWGWHWELLRPMLAFAIPALFTGISFYWLKLSDRFFLLHYQGKAEVGLYTVAYSLASRCTSSSWPSAWRGRSGTTRACTSPTGTAGWWRAARPTSSASTWSPSSSSGRSCRC